MKKQIYIDNLYLTKKLTPEYQDFFNDILNKISNINSLTDLEKSAAVNYALEQCLNAIKDGKTVKEAFPDNDYLKKFTKKSVLQSVKKKLCQQDYEKVIISSIWIVFTLSMLLFFLNNLITGKYLVNYWLDALIGCVAGAIAFQNYRIKHRIIKRYNFKSIYKYLDIVTVLACVFIKIISKSNFDITYLLLVISFFVTKKNITPEFEVMLKK